MGRLDHGLRAGGYHAFQQRYPFVVCNYKPGEAEAENGSAAKTSYVRLSMHFHEGRLFSLCNFVCVFGLAHAVACVYVTIARWCMRGTDNGTRYVQPIRHSRPQAQLPLPLVSERDHRG